jgi:hypothetical protein
MPGDPGTVSSVDALGHRGERVTGRHSMSCPHRRASKWSWARGAPASLWTWGGQEHRVSFSRVVFRKHQDNHAVARRFL